MAPPTKYSTEQLAFIDTYQDKFLECKASRDYEPFWNPFFEDWAAKFPERAAIFPQIPLDIALTAEQKNEEAEAWKLRRQRLTEKLCNYFSGLKAGRRANATHNATINNMIGWITKSSKDKPSCVLKDWKMYARMHYSDKVKDTVKCQQDVLKHDPDAKPAKKTNLSIIREQTKLAFAEESEDIKMEVREAVEAMKVKKRVEIQDVQQGIPSLDNAVYISKIGAILTQFFEELHLMTGWTFSVLMGGPDPSAGGTLDISSFHVGTTNIQLFVYVNFITAEAAALTSRTLPEDATSSLTPAAGSSSIPNAAVSPSLLSDLIIPLTNTNAAISPSLLPNLLVPPTDGLASHDIDSTLNTIDFFSNLQLQHFSDEALPDLQLPPLHDSNDFNPHLPILPMPPQLQPAATSNEQPTSGDIQILSLQELLDRPDMNLPSPKSLSPQSGPTITSPRLHQFLTSPSNTYNFMPIRLGLNGPNTTCDSLPLAETVPQYSMTTTAPPQPIAPCQPTTPSQPTAPPQPTTPPQPTAPPQPTTPPQPTALPQHKRAVKCTQGSNLSYPVFRTYIRQYSHASSGPSDALSMSPVPIRIPLPPYIRPPYLRS
ncbi:hypothetical protein EV424DRAFT_1546897 [Suillus variegatus]|nr:hypothetical protein EV424DRAFT_1546897 [Suillus variegatus]